jgi:hypothetical protein
VVLEKVVRSRKWWRLELEVAGGAFVLVEFENGLRAGERLEPCA